MALSTALQPVERCHPVDHVGLARIHKEYRWFITLVVVVGQWVCCDLVCRDWRLHWSIIITIAQAVIISNQSAQSSECRLVFGCRQACIFYSSSHDRSVHPSVHPKPGGSLGRGKESCAAWSVVEPIRTSAKRRVRKWKKKNSIQEYLCMRQVVATAAMSIDRARPRRLQWWMQIDCAAAAIRIT